MNKDLPPKFCILPFISVSIGTNGLIHPSSLKNKTPYLKGVIGYMKGEDKESLWPSFLSYTRQLDKIRGENIDSILPDYVRTFIYEK